MWKNKWETWVGCWHKSSRSQLKLKRTFVEMQIGSAKDTRCRHCQMRFRSMRSFVIRFQKLTNNIQINEIAADWLRRNLAFVNCKQIEEIKLKLTKITSKFYLRRRVSEPIWFEASTHRSLCGASPETAGRLCKCSCQPWGCECHDDESTTQSCCPNS